MSDTLNLSHATAPTSHTRSESTNLLGFGLRELPNNQQCEQALLGALLANNKALDRVSGFLKSEHFYDPIHAKIYERLVARVEAGQVADVIALRADFEGAGILEEVGGPAYLVQLLSAMVGIINAAEYARIVHDCFLRRQWIPTLEEALNLAFGMEAGVTAEEQFERMETAMQRLQGLRTNPEHLVSLDDAVSQAIASGELAHANGGVLGLSTGYHAMDVRLGGHEGSTLNVWAGRPGMGKTSLGMGSAMRLAAVKVDRATGAIIKPGAKVGFISLEMSGPQVGRRALSLASGVPLGSIRRGHFAGDGDMAMKIKRGQMRLRGMSLLFEVEPALSVSAIRQRARAMRRKMGGLDILYIDHLHLIGRGEDAGRHGDAHALSVVTYGLKMLSKELDIPIVLLAQLNRGVEGRDEKRPELADLRGSGSIEQDADSVGFIYRPEYYIGDQPPERGTNEHAGNYAERVGEWEERRRQAAGKAEVIFRKVRDEEANVTAMLGFEGPRTRFYDLPSEEATALMPLHEEGR